MNELFFFFHILIVLGFVLIAFRLGPFALTALIAMQAVFANLFVIKQTPLFGFTATCSDVFAVGSILGLNLLQEFFGKEAAKRAVKISFFCLLFYFLMSQAHLFYRPALSDGTHEAFFSIFSSTFRIVASSIGVYWVVQKLDIQLYSWLKELFSGRVFPLRIALSLAVSELLDTILFSYLGLYGLVESVFDIILVSYLVKCLVILLSGSLVALFRRFSPKGEDVSSV